MLVVILTLSQWTTDQDLIHACASLNVRDVTNIKFYENRTNGQSKGYCAIDVGTLNSAKTLMHELRNVLVGQYVRFDIHETCRLIRLIIMFSILSNTFVLSKI